MDPNAPLIAETISAAPRYASVLLVLAGGISAAIGGLVAKMYEAHVARRVRFEEAMGEQQAKVLGPAMRLMNALASFLVQGAEKDVLDYIHQNNDWMLDNEPFLPQKAVENWHSIRHIVLSMMRKDERQHRMTDELEREKLIDEITEDWQHARGLAKEAEQLIRAELKLTPFQIHRRQQA